MKTVETHLALPVAVMRDCDGLHTSNLTTGMATLQSMTQHHRNQLQEAIGTKVTIENAAHQESDENKVAINFGGTLEYSEETDSFYVRVGEDYMAGAMGVSFKSAHVAEIAKRIYGESRIILS